MHLLMHLRDFINFLNLTFMKIAKLLVLSALLLLGSNVAKAVDDNVWQKPSVTEFASLVDGEVYYFYLTGCQLFFTQGNAYGTQASAGTTGLKVRAEQQSEGIWTLTDYVQTQSAWKMWWFVQDANIMYVDYNNQPDYLWEITDMGGQVYRLSPSAQNPNWNDNTKFVGLDRTTNAENTVLNSDLTADGGAFIDWKLVPEAAYEQYEAAELLYDAAMELKDLLNKAESIGADVAAQIAVYNNTNSTLDELKKAIEETKAAITAREEELARENYENATVNNPVDVTSLFITNPTFVGNKYDGWAGSGFGGYNPKENAERYNMTFDTYQQLSGLKEGVYKLSVNAFYRAGNAQPAYDNYKAQNDASKYSKLYAATATDSLVSSIASPFTAKLTENMTTGNWSTATDAETGEAWVIPNDMVASDEFFKAGYCNDNHVFINVGEDGELKIGVRKDQTISGDWSIFDDFALTYYGNGDDAYQLILESAKENVKEYDLTNVIYTQAYADAYNAAVAALNSATTKDAIMSAIKGIQKATEDLDKNIELWKQLVAIRDEAFDAANDDLYEEEYREVLGEWIDFDYDDAIKKRDLTNDELEEMLANVRAMIKDVYVHPKEGADMTKLMVNPDFEQGATGWTKEAASGGNVGIGGTNTNTCYEAWNNAKFDIYQIVENAPKGVYEISVQGFYRYGRTAYQAYLNHEEYTTKETCPVFVYMNSNITPFTNVYGDPMQITDEAFYSGNSTDYTSETLEDGTVLFFPNGMASSAIAFENGMYTQSAFGLVAQDGDPIRIGVKGSSNQLGDSWSIWDNFKITYRAFRADVVRPVLEQAIIDAEANLNSAIGKDVAEALQTAIDEAKAVVNGDDGDAMFDALSKLFDLQEAVSESKALFSRLEAANEQLAQAINNSVASVATINEAKALNQAITDGLDNHSYKDSEVEDLMNQIKKMINRLGIPQNMESASDASPVECTTVIVNPAYVDGNDNGWTGGAAVNAEVNDAEKFNTTFDYFQLLQGLPAGTYKVSVQGFFRYGGYVNDYTTYTADPSANNNAFLYAAVDNDTVSAPMHRLASQAVVMESLPDGWVYASEENQLAVPNSMATAADAFQSPGSDGAPMFANNNVIVKVGEDGNLTIGLKKNINSTDDWCIWTNWQLFYYGKNSSLQPSDNPLSIDEINGNGVVSAEFYTVDGARVNGLQRGITIVRETLTDGTIRVRKVSIK